MKQLLLLLPFIFICAVAQAQWTQLKGPTASQINCLLNNKEVLYAGTEVGVYVSTDGGASWTARNNGLIQSSGLEWNTVVDVFAAMGNRVFAGTDGGLFMTTDGGASWTLMLDSLTYFTGISVLAVNGSSLFEGTYSDGVWMSPDSGATWRNISDNLPINDVEMLFTLGNKIMVSGEPLQSNLVKGYYSTADTGKTWVNSTSSLSTHYVYSMAFNKGELYAVTEAGIYISNDTGTTWKLYNSSAPGLNLLFNDNNVYLGADVSSDSGITWKSANLNAEGGGSCVCFAGDTIFAITMAGIFYSNDSAATWHSANTGIYNTVIEGLAANDNYLFAVNDSGFYTSPDEGNTWTLASKKISGFVKLITKESEIFAAGQSGGIYISRDNGFTWNTVNNGLSGFQWINSLPTININENSILLSYSDLGQLPIVYLSTNDGTSWKPFDKNLPHTYPYNNPISSFAFSGDTVYATLNGKLYYSLDTAANWIQIDSSSSFYYVLVVTNGNNNITVMNSWSSFISSNDRGATWDTSADFTFYFNRNDIETLFALNDTIYAGDGYGGTYFSADNCQDWYPCNPINFCNPSYVVNNGSIYVGGALGTGIWKHFSSTRLINTGVREIKNGKGFSLYPNPTESTVTITSGINNTHPNLAIYNVFGKLMFQQNNNAPNTVVNISAFSPGIYFVKMSDESGSIETKKLVKQ